MKVNIIPYTKDVIKYNPEQTHMNAPLIAHYSGKQAIEYAQSSISETPTSMAFGKTVTFSILQDESEGSFNVRQQYLLDLFMVPVMYKDEDVCQVIPVTNRSNTRYQFPTMSRALSDMNFTLSIALWTSIALATTVAFFKIKKKMAIKQLQFQAETEAAWTAVSSDPTEDNIKAYRKACKRQNTIGQLFGCSRVNNTNYWGDTSDSVAEKVSGVVVGDGGTISDAISTVSTKASETITTLSDQVSSTLSSVTSKIDESTDTTAANITESTDQTAQNIANSTEDTFEHITSTTATQTETVLVETAAIKDEIAAIDVSGITDIKSAVQALDTQLIAVKDLLYSQISAVGTSVDATSANVQAVASTCDTINSNVAVVNNNLKTMDEETHASFTSLSKTATDNSILIGDVLSDVEILHQKLRNLLYTE